MDPLEPIRSIKHGTVVFEYDNTVVYVDPFEIEDDTHDADLIIITHAHHKHFSLKDIKKVCQQDTCYATTPDIAAELERELDIDRAYISHLTYDTPPAAFECGAMVMPVPAVNERHSLEEGFGFCLEFAGFKYYITGDTDFFAESVNCNVIFAVCDGVSNMTKDEKQVLHQLKAMDKMPDIVVPYHCTHEKAHALSSILTENNINCIIL